LALTQDSHLATINELNERIVTLEEKQDAQQKALAARMSALERRPEGQEGELTMKIGEAEKATRNHEREIANLNRSLQDVEKEMNIMKLKMGNGGVMPNFLIRMEEQNNQD
jgi:chromosome segregation ATPase